MKHKTFFTAFAIIALAVTAVTALLCPTNAAKPVDIGNGVSRIDVHNYRQKTAAYELTAEEYDLVCRVVWLEAGGEGEELQKAITEVILNRVKCGHWGDKIADTIYAWSAGYWEFSVVPDIPNATPSETTKRIVADVFQNGVTIPERVVAFRKDHYHDWQGAVDEFAIGNVYFSSSSWLE